MKKAKRKQTKKQVSGIVRIVPGEDGYTREMFRVARDRTRSLLEWWGRGAEFYPLPVLTMSCYLQGVRDASEAMVEMERRKEDGAES